MELILTGDFMNAEEAKQSGKLSSLSLSLDACGVVADMCLWCVSHQVW
jgi:hypothetical protein